MWNVTGWGVNSVRIDATLRDADDNGVGSEYTYSMRGRLADGMTSPFSVWFSDPPGWASYDLEVNWNRTSEAVFLLGVSNSTRFFDNNDACHVVGEAWNPYGERRSSIKAVVTLYDATGTVIGAGYSFTDPDELEPGQTASFDVEVAYWVGRPDRSRVAVHRLEVVGD